MKWWVWVFIGILVVGLGLLAYYLAFPPEEGEQQKPKPWLILYASEAEESELEKYNPIFLDPENHPPLDPLKKKHAALYARVDLADLFLEIADLKKGDKTDSILNWMDEIIQIQIPPLFIEGFNGLFIDGLEELQSEYRDWAGLKQTLVQFILKLKIQYPSIPIVVKDAYSFLPEIGHTIKGYIATSVATTFDASEGEYRFVDAALHEKRMERLFEIQKHYPELEIFILDFWDPSDKKTIQDIYSIDGKKSFRVYVGNEALDEIVSPQ